MPVRAGEPLNPAATRARLLRVAESEFYAHGVDAVGVSDLAAAAGASKLSIYRHFGSKAGLVREIARDRSRRVHHWIGTSLADVPAGRERIHALFALFADWFSEEHFAGCAIVNATIDTRGAEPDLAEVTRHHLRQYCDLLSENLAVEVSADLIEPLARQLLILLEGAILVAALTGDQRPAWDAQRAADALIDGATR